ncbi:MAG: prepilin peptidase [Gammaproteobacteria bacterium]|nr:prepilin peptidase [Gammaproteobacteria bacterium]
MLSSAMVIAVGLPAVWIDARTRRIPNVLVGATLLAAFAVQIGSNGTTGAGLAIAGAAVGLVALLPLYLAGAMGAGDVKFMAALGALLGPYGATWAVALTLIAGSALALAMLGWRRWLALEAPAAGSPGSRASRIPYAGAIVTGSLLATLITS